MSDAETIARALNGRKYGAGWLCLCPAHDDRRKPSLSISEGEGGRVLWKCHAGCSQLSVRYALIARGLLTGSSVWMPPDPEDVRRREQARRAEQERRLDYPRRIFASASRDRGGFSLRYLREVRGIHLEALPDALRNHCSVPHPAGTIAGHVPAMLARVDTVDGEFHGLHRTFLRPDGLGKAGLEPDKAAIGPIAGSSVHLNPAGEILVVGEGIESTLSFAVATGLPGWAALSTSGLRRLVLPSLPLASELIIAADNDAPGLKAAAALAERARAEGRKVRVVAPPGPGDDWNDVARRS